MVSTSVGSGVKNQQKLVVAKAVGKTFGSSSKPVLRDLSLSVKNGELVALLGPNGCGKTTFLNIVAGLVEPDCGTVSVADMCSDLVGHSAYMQQDDLLLPWRSAGSNVRLPLEIAGMPKSKAKQTVAEMAAEFGMADILTLYPWQLSGGMRQRISMMRALLHRSSVLLLDEPFSALDAITRAKLHDWVQRVLATRNKAVLLVTHDVDEAILLADRVVLMGLKSESSIVDQIEIPFEHPRRPQDLLEPAAIQLKKRIVQTLENGLAEKV